MGMALQQIAHEVYTCLQDDRGLGTSNSGLINRGGGLVVDTFWDLPHTRIMIDHYATVWDGPPRRVVNTHHNGDHCWGNQLFPGAEIIGHRLCAESFGRERPEALQALRDLRGHSDPATAAMAEALAEWDFSGIELVPPTTLVEDRLEIDLDGSGVELIHVGPAHTAGDLIVHLPREGVLFAGDVLFRLCTPIGWEGTFAKWEAALDLIVRLKPDVIVPGHGPLCNVEAAREMKGYLEYVRNEARAFYVAGVSVVDAAKRIDFGPYGGWTEPERVIFTIERAYRELSGDSCDAPIDAVAMFRGMYEVRLSRSAGRRRSQLLS